MSESQLERIITFSPAWDKRDPNPHKNYGVHGVELRMVLRGPKGATQFVVYTNWHLPHVQEELDSKYTDHRLFCHPRPADLGYHSPTPRYEDQSVMTCDLLPGGECYYDGSGLNAVRIYHVLLKRGSEGVWEELESYYRELFEGDVHA